MVNSTLCPLCKDGIGHSMDEAHARVVKEMLAALKVVRSVHYVAQEIVARAIAEAEVK